MGRDIEALGSTDHIRLLDAVDELRALGLGDHLDLPQLIVCGDQSSGKSSILSALSGFPFPVKDNLCTRFATEVILRRGPGKSIAVEIHPANDRSDEEKARLKAFDRSLDDMQKLPTIIEDAGNAMNLGRSGNAFSEDRLRLTLTAPDIIQLTIVDLPGLIHSPNKKQNVEDISMISNLVNRYMKQERSIILAIVSAKYDHAIQAVIERSREIDPLGRRTLGIITKPDKLDEGSGSEEAFIGLAKNESHHFDLGWHVVRNLGENENPATTNRDETERAFFRDTKWCSVDPARTGIEALQEHLSHILFFQIKRELPKLIKEIGFKLAASRRELEKLGPSRLTAQEQRRYLLDVFSKCQKKCCAGCDGQYEDPMFDAVEAPPAVRLRAIERNDTEQFCRDFAKTGPNPANTEGIVDSKTGRRMDTVEWIEEFMCDRRGLELPGTFNPLLIGQLFQVFSRPWARLSQEHIRHLLKRVYEAVIFVVPTVADSEAAEKIHSQVVRPIMSDITSAAQAKFDVLMNRQQYVTTYNHYFTETAARLRLDRWKKRAVAQMKKRFEMGNIADMDEHNISWMLDALMPRDSAGMMRTAAEELFDYTQAYYKVS